jgi:hypothetical protein
VRDGYDGQHRNENRGSVQDLEHAGNWVKDGAANHPPAHVDLQGRTITKLTPKYRAVGCGDESEGLELGPDDLLHVVGGNQPVSRLRYGAGNVLERTLAVSLLGDTVEELGELDKAAVALDEPLPIPETASLDLTYELYVRRERRALGDHYTWRRLSSLGSGWLIAALVPVVSVTPYFEWFGVAHLL